MQQCPGHWQLLRQYLPVFFSKSEAVKRVGHIGLTYQVSLDVTNFGIP